MQSTLRRESANREAPGMPTPSIPSDGFFAHHGPWAIGVKLFRKLNFPAKAGLISVVFLFPLLVLCVAYVRSSQEAIDFARQERAGVAVLKTVEPWVIEVQKQRRLTLTGQRDTPDVAAIAEKLRAVRAAVAESGIDLSPELSSLDC